MQSPATKQLSASSARSTGAAPVAAPRSRLQKLARFSKLAAAATSMELGKGFLEGLSKIGSATGGLKLSDPGAKATNSGGEVINPQKDEPSNAPRSAPRAAPAPKGPGM